MLLPPYLNARSPRHRKRRTELSPPPPPPPPPPPVTEVLISAVTLVDGGRLDFEFNAPVTCDGAGSGDVWAEVPGEGEVHATASEQVSARVVRFTFEQGAFVAGVAWHVDNPPEDLDLHGLPMPVPQAGVVAGG